MKKLLLLFLFGLILNNTFAQFDRNFRKVSVDSINARTEFVYINDNVFYKDTLLSDYITFYAAGEVVNFGTANQVPFMNATGTDLGYSSNFEWNDTSLLINYGTGNVLIGESSGYSLTTGVYNTFLGSFAGYSNNNDNNVFIGRAAGNSNTSFENTFIGYSSGVSNVTGNSNTMVGATAGNDNTGTNNVFIGRSAGQANTGSNNTYIGTRSGSSSSSGSGNIFIGNLAGSAETGSNKLYIENSNSATPLIYGEFDNDLVKINGYLDADSGVYQVEMGQFGRNAAYNTTVADTWVTVKMDTSCANKQTAGFEFNSDSTGIICRFPGIVLVSGHATMYNNSAGSVTAGTYFRLTKNSVELPFFNTARTRSYSANGYDDLVSLTGTIEVATNDTIRVQGRVTNVNIDIQGADGAVFDSARAFTISLIQILKKP